MNEYKAWDIPQDRLVPFLIESTGALGPKAKAKELLAARCGSLAPITASSAKQLLSPCK